jgi:DNA-binding MarR family transcriptional regulator
MNWESLQAFKSTQYIATEQQARVLEILRQHPDGLTRKQVAIRSGLKLQSVCGRCAELLRSGVITLKDLPGDSDYYEVRLTASGRPAAV